MAAVSTPADVSKPAITVLPSNYTVVSTVAINSGSGTGTGVKKASSLPRKVSKPGIQIVRESSSSEEEEVSQLDSLPLYKITVRDGKSVLAKVGTKTLLPVNKKIESDVDAVNTIASVVLKSDPISKKFRYITKPISEKEKSDVNELKHDDLSNRDISDNHQLVTGGNNDTLSKQKIVLPKCDKDESINVDESESSLKSKENKSKVFSSKTCKESIRPKDNQKSVKNSKEYDSEKNRDKSKDRKSSRDSDKDRKKSDHKSHKGDKSRERDREKDKYKNKEKDCLKEKHKESDKSKLKEKYGKEKEGGKTSEKVQTQADKDKDTLERLKTPAINLLGKIPKKSSSHNLNSSTKAIGSSNNTQANKQTSYVESADKIGDAKKVIDGRPLKMRPKTVKTFNSKFRSTGLEEEIKPPPSRSNIKKKADEKRPLGKYETLTKNDGSSPKESHQPPEKKPKLSSDVSIDLQKDKILEKPGGIKLIPPKPKRKFFIYINFFFFFLGNKTYFLNFRP